MTIAQRLEKAMALRKGATKAALARASKVSAPSVSDWFSGQTKSLMAEPLIRAAHYLGVQPLWLAVGEGPMLANEVRDAGSASEYLNPWPFKSFSRQDITALGPAAHRQLERVVGAFLESTVGNTEPVIAWRTIAINLAGSMDAALKQPVYTEFVRMVDELSDPGNKTSTPLRVESSTSAAL